MSDSRADKKSVRQGKVILLWLSEYNRRWFGLIVFVVYLFVATASTAIQYSWRMGFQEPTSRMEYAIVTTFGDSIFAFGAILALVAVTAPVYRIHYGGHND